MPTTEERVSRLEAENIKIKTHFATKADLYKALYFQTGILAVMLSVAIGVILRFG